MSISFSHYSPVKSHNILLLRQLQLPVWPPVNARQRGIASDKNPRFPGVPNREAHTPATSGGVAVAHTGGSAIPSSTTSTDLIPRSADGCRMRSASTTIRRAGKPRFTPRHARACVPPCASRWARAKDKPLSGSSSLSVGNDTIASRHDKRLRRLNAPLITPGPIDGHRS
jgi:hypothetical protein